MKHELNPETAHILEGVEQFWKDICALPQADTQIPDRHRFILLLSGLSSYRKVPGRSNMLLGHRLLL